MLHISLSQDDDFPPPPPGGPQGEYRGPEPMYVSRSQGKMKVL